MSFLLLLAVLVVLNVIYVIGFLGAQVLRNSPQHYFLGFRSSFFSFTIRKVKFDVALYIPLIGFSRIYTLDSSGKKHLFYPWQAFDVPLLKRLLLTYSGVLALFFFGVVLSIFGVYTSTERYIPKEEVIRHGIYPSQQAREAGFRTGDKVVAINGKDYSDYSELIRPEIIHSENTEYTIQRNGQQLVISIDKSFVESLPLEEPFLEINSSFTVRVVQSGSPAEDAGIETGDRIVKVNGSVIQGFPEMKSYFKSDDDGEVVLEIKRGTNADPGFEKTIKLDESRRMGISVVEEVEYSERTYSLIQSIPIGIARFWSRIGVQLDAVRRIISVSSGRARQTVSGPMGIAAAFGSVTFSWIASVTSAYIGFVVLLNLLPLPKSAMLEVFPLGYEAVTGKRLSYKTFEIIRQISIVLLIALWVWQFVSELFSLFS